MRDPPLTQPPQNVLKYIIQNICGWDGKRIWKYHQNDGIQ